MIIREENASRTNGTGVGRVSGRPGDTPTEDAGSLPSGEIRLPPSALTDKAAELVWFPPALRGRLDEAARQELNRIEALVPTLAPQARQIWWDYTTRASAAAREMEDAEEVARRQLAAREGVAAADQKQIDAEAEERRRQAAGVEAAQEKTRAEFAQAIAEAWLPYAVQDPIRAEAVEEALLESAPDLDELSGEHGIVPAPAREKSMMRRWLSGLFLGAVSPIFCGFMVALCLGSMTGLLSLNRLKSGGDLPLLALTAVLGAIIVVSIGGSFANAVKTLAWHREDRRPPAEDVDSVPRLGGGGIPYAQLILASALVVAEITAEAFGLRTLHQQVLLSEQRLTGHAGALLPFGCYLLIGTIISAPVILYKGTVAWRECLETQREAWLYWRRRVWLQGRREEESVQRAFRAAYALETLGQDLARHAARLEALQARRAALWDEVRVDPMTQARLDYATAQAVGEAARLHHTIEALMETAANELKPHDGKRR